MTRLKTLLAALLFLAIPAVSLAFPFGGSINQLVFCYNNAIYAGLGAPRGGPFIWTPSTQTYQFGPPRQVGQWLLGLAAPPYYCIVSREPVIVWSGILITMMGSSGAAAPSYTSGGSNVFGQSGGGSASAGSTSGGSGGGGTSSPVPTQTSLPQQPTTPYSPLSATLGHMVISEIFYAVDASHGTDPANEWVELYNGATTTIDLTGWSISDAAVTRTIPGSIQLKPNTFLVIMGDASTASKWNIPSTAQISVLGTAIGNGLDANGDRVTIKKPDGTVVDAASWGNDTSVFNPAPQPVAAGHSMARGSLASDSHSASDWIDAAQPTPGQ